MKNERLRNNVVIGVVVEDCFQERPGDDSPGFVHHFSGETSSGLVFSVCTPGV